MPKIGSTSSTLRERSEMLRRLREMLHENSFVEIASPVLIAGSAPASHTIPINASFGMLRTALELNLRRALLSGISRVYEIGPCFRFDGIDSTHLPEFHMLELFAEGVNYAELVSLSLELLGVALGIDSPPIRRISVCDWFAENYGIDYSLLEPEALGECLDSRFEWLGGDGHTTVGNKFSAVVDRLLPVGHGIVLVEEFPTCTICLAERNSSRPNLIDRFEIFVDGLEVAHGFSDCLIIEDLRARMMASGAEHHDEAFLEVLAECECSPSSGVGFGIERLLATKMGHENIRDCVHLPQW